VTEKAYLTNKIRNMIDYVNRINFVSHGSDYYRIVRGGSDKTLARPEWKEATTTKLGIYSAYSPRSSLV